MAVPRGSRDRGAGPSVRAGHRGDMGAPEASEKGGHVVNWENRILGLENVDPESLLANPANWRRHPGSQRNALRDSLATLGWIGVITVNKRTGYVVDGHARIEEALSKHEKTVPVLYVDLSPELERVALAVYDPIGEMAQRDQEALDELLADMPPIDAPGLQALLDSMSKSLPEDEAKGQPESPTDEVTCPACGHTFGIGIRVKPSGKAPRGDEIPGGN